MLGSRGVCVGTAYVSLPQVFASPGRRRYVDYERFCTVIAEALVQASLERAPLMQPVPHVPTRDSPLNFLGFEERSIVAGALAKLAKHPDHISNILEVFKVSQCNNDIQLVIFFHARQSSRYTEAEAMH